MIKKRVGIVGYGVVGKRRRSFIDAHPALTIVAVSDITFPEDVVEADGARAYRDYQHLLKEDLNVLFVCVPNYLAPEATIAGLERGLHVFCEKPPGRTVKDVEAVMAIEKRHPGLILKYGFNHRYHDSVQDALKIIESGELGGIININGVYGKSRIVPFSGGWRAERQYAGGGILLDQGIHMLDLMRLFCGEFQEVRSFVSNDFWRHDVEDNAYALLRDGKGRVAMLQSSATLWEHRFSLDIFLERGYLKLSGLLTGSKSYGEETLRIGRASESDNGVLHSEQRKYLDDPSWKREIDEFADVIEGKAPVRFGTSIDALNTMKLVYRIYFADEAWREKFSIPNPDNPRAVDRHTSLYKSTDLVSPVVISGMNNLEKIFSGSPDIQAFAGGYFRYLSELMQSLDPGAIGAFMQTLENPRVHDSTVFVIGNGGSASTASHIGNDIGMAMVKMAEHNRPYRVFPLTDHVSTMTAVGNDYGYDDIFLKQLAIHYRDGDVLLAISASGNSPNVVKAAEWVRGKQGTVLGLLGFDGGKLSELCHVPIVVATPKGEYGPVEDVHLILNHMLTSWIQQKFGGGAAAPTETPMHPSHTLYAI